MLVIAAPALMHTSTDPNEDEVTIATTGAVALQQGRLPVPLLARVFRRRGSPVGIGWQRHSIRWLTAAAPQGRRSRTIV